MTHAARPSLVDGDRARREELARIHIAKGQLRWSDDEYRDIMATVCGGIRSAALLDQAGRKRLLAHQQACLRANGHPDTRPAHPRRQHAPLSVTQRKMWSLWMLLADAGAVSSRTMRALETYVRRQTGVDRMQWLNGKQEDLVIESLKQWLKRLPVTGGGDGS